MATGRNNAGACGLPCVPVSSTPPLHPPNGPDIDPELMHEVAAQPERCGLRIERQPDPASFKILGSANAGSFIDKNITMTKNTRWKHRQRYERAFARAMKADEFGR